MKTREQIDSEHDANIQNIRASYHERHEISHEEYHSQLNAENERYEAELIAEGYFSQTLPPHELTLAELRLQEIISNPVEALTMPEVWEAIRILARLRGIEGAP